MPSNPQAQLALAIAQRHAGEASIAIEWNDRLVDDLGLTYVAQVVQAAADAGDEQMSRYVERALALADLLPAERGSLRARGAAARALGQVGNTLAACPLAAALVQPGQDLLVRRALAAALARIPHPDAQAPLLEALRDPDPQVRAYAAAALGQVGNEDAHAPLQALTADKSRLIRGTVSDRARTAVELLERRGRREAQQT